MSTFKRIVSVTAGATNTNLMTGSKFEFLGRAAVVRVYGAADIAAGGTQGVGEIDLTLGNVVVGEDLPLPIAAAGQGPTRNEHLITRGIGAPGDRIQLRLRETGGADTVTARVQVDIDEIG